MASRIVAALGPKKEVLDGLVAELERKKLCPRVYDRVLIVEKQTFVVRVVMCDAAEPEVAAGGEEGSCPTTQ